MNKKTLYLTESGIIAALYIVLTLTQAIIFPQSVYAAIQFRVSEFLMILCIYRKSAIIGLTIGCLISNIANSAIPLDIIMGSLATLLAGIAIYQLRNIRIFKLPILSLLMPAIFNGLIIGFEVAFFLTEAFNISSFLLCAVQIAIGELAVLFLIGLPFSIYLEKGNKIKKIFKN